MDPSCNNPTPPTDGEADPDAIAAGLELNPCGKHVEYHANMEFSMSGGLKIGGKDKGKNGLNGEASGSLDSGGSVGSNGCSAITLIAQAYKIKHDNINCLIQKASRDATTTSTNTNTLTFNCTNCTNVGKLKFSQTINTKQITQTNFTSSLVSQIKQETDDAVDTFANVVNTNKTEFGALGGDSRVGSATDTIINDTKMSMTNNNIVENILNEMYNSNNTEINLINYDGGPSQGDIEITQEIHSTMVATQIMNSTLVNFLEQFSSTDLKTVLDVTNTNTSKGLGSFLSSLMLTWLIPLIVAVVIIFLILKGGVAGITKNKRLFSLILVAGAIVSLIFAILAFTKKDVDIITGCACIGAMLVCLGGLFLVYRKQKTGGNTKTPPAPNSE